MDSDLWTKTVIAALLFFFIGVLLPFLVVPFIFGIWLPDHVPIFPLHLFPWEPVQGPFIRPMNLLWGVVLCFAVVYFTLSLVILPRLFPHTKPPTSPAPRPSSASPSPAPSGSSSTSTTPSAAPLTAPLSAFIGALFAALALLRERSDRLLMEFHRKVAHLYGAVVPLLYYLGLSVGGARKPVACVFCVVAWLAITGFDIIRVRHPTSKVAEMFRRQWGSHLRPREVDGLSASPFYFAGCAVAFVCFAPDTAIVAILVLVFGDLAAALVGVGVGRHPLPLVGKKSFEGFTACVAASAAIVVLAGGTVPVALVAGLAAAIAEALGGLHRLCDDNVLMPLVTGAVLDGARSLHAGW
eukprot:TRINITY_DN1537_c0_g2_i1.p1 TRINITY_DN1537_c0_g2~~TRINITY_DN1537_c0_g2_i1.p1  ORF type:complete len:354 (-),score=62.97 TRINITY_DN1537_c0_g2_i1:119-1180(-)